MSQWHATRLFQVMEADKAKKRGAGDTPKALNSASPRRCLKLEIVTNSKRYFAVLIRTNNRVIAPTLSSNEVHLGTL